jgi:hypothetical protein
MKAAPEARTSVGPALDQLSERIEQWKIDFERFLAGALPLPPDEARARIVRELRDLRGASIKGAAEQFRLSTLEARFNSYSELNQRRLREREEGRQARAVHAAAETVAHDPMAGVVISDRLEADAVAALHGALSRQKSGAPAMELETFRGYIARQIESIRIKTGCEAVQFRLAEEEGKLKLKAKPVGA